MTVTGQNDNIGDSLLRRGLIDSLREEQTALSLYIGENDSDYLSGLGLREEDRLFSSRKAWFSSLFRESSRRGSNVSVLYNPGETGALSGGRKRWRLEKTLFKYPKSRGVFFAQAGTGIVDAANTNLSGLAQSFNHFDLLYWRDALSRDKIGVGLVAPDWAFNLGSAERPTSYVRDRITLSFRNDRPIPDKAWAEQIRTISKDLELPLQLVVQVRRDHDRSHEVARLLGGAEVLEWPSDLNHREQELRVRDAYQRSLYTISDRTHGLIMAMTEGSMPVVSSTSTVSSTKAVRTLKPAFEGLDLEVNVEDLTGFPTVDQQVEVRSECLWMAVDNARGQLQKVIAEIRDGVNS